MSTSVIVVGIEHTGHHLWRGEQSYQADAIQAHGPRDIWEALDSEGHSRPSEPLSNLEILLFDGNPLFPSEPDFSGRKQMARRIHTTVQEVMADVMRLESEGRVVESRRLSNAFCIFARKITPPSVKLTIYNHLLRTPPSTETADAFYRRWRRFWASPSIENRSMEALMAPLTGWLERRSHVESESVRPPPLMWHMITSYAGGPEPKCKQGHGRCGFPNVTLTAEAALTAGVPLKIVLMTRLAIETMRERSWPYQGYVAERAHMLLEQCTIMDAQLAAAQALMAGRARGLDIFCMPYHEYTNNVTQAGLSRFLGVDMRPVIDRVYRPHVGHRPMEAHVVAAKVRMERVADATAQKCFNTLEARWCRERPGV